MLGWLLLLVPVAVTVHWLMPEAHSLVFGSAALAIIPLAGWMGRATEALAARAGEGVGGLLNATFGNAAELVIALAALRHGLYDVVKASIAGSIIGNILLVLGAAMFAGGLRFQSQRYNITAARSQATMLLIAAISFVFAGAFRDVVQPGAKELIGYSMEIAVVLLVVYVLDLVFSLVTHRRLFEGSAEVAGTEGHAGPEWSVGKGLAVLGLATAAVAWMSEILVAAIEPAAKALGLSSLFVGVFVVAIIGNAAEHSTAIFAALRNRMDLSLSIAIGSSVQIALFVAPALVLVSLVVGPAPMDISIRPGLTLCIVLSVLIAAPVAGDGESNWLKGVALLAVYLIFALAFLAVPGLP
jgi:Ca2+:H+ antiporter